jgi:hypothetical protein
MSSVAVRDPILIGSNDTVTMQYAPGATGTPVQPSASIWKSAGLVPPRLTLEMTRGIVPVLVILTFRPGVAVPKNRDPKPRLPAVMLIPATATKPVPLSGIVCGLPTPSLVTVIEPATVPDVVGENVT